MPVTYVGVGTCDAGWLSIEVAGSDWELTLLPSAFSVYYNYRDAARILVDVPIGLLDIDNGSRACDRAARARLSPHRHRSIFPVPCRTAVYEDTYAAATAVNQEIQGKALNSYSWGMASRIRELDELLDFTPADHHRIRETHPEICFWAFNGFEPTEHSKQTAAGVTERREVLRRVDPRSEALITAARDKYEAEGVTVANILDAVAIALTAARDEAELQTLPDDPSTDARGLPMEIVYPAGDTAAQRTMTDFA